MLGGYKRRTFDGCAGADGFDELASDVHGVTALTSASLDAICRRALSLCCSTAHATRADGSSYLRRKARRRRPATARLEGCGPAIKSLPVGRTGKVLGARCRPRQVAILPRAGRFSGRPS